MEEGKTTIVWSAYMKFRAIQRGYVITRIEEIVRYADERYFDTVTRRVVVVGKHDDRLVIIPIERVGDSVTPVTIHATTRQQIRFRLRSGRFIHE
jgi:hypothetical protein